MSRRILLTLACLPILLLPLAAAQVPGSVTVGPCKAEHGLFGVGLIARARCAQPGQEFLFVGVSRLDVFPTCEVRVLGVHVADCDRPVLP